MNALYIYNPQVTFKGAHTPVLITMPYILHTSQRRPRAQVSITMPYICDARVTKAHMRTGLNNNTSYTTHVSEMRVHAQVSTTMLYISKAHTHTHTGFNNNALRPELPRKLANRVKPKQPKPLRNLSLSQHKPQRKAHRFGQCI